MGRLPVLIGKDEDGYCVTFESFAYGKLGYVRRATSSARREIVRITADGYETLSEPRDEMTHLRVPLGLLRLSQLKLRGRQRRVHALSQRRHHGPRRARARGLLPEVDYVAGVPDSGLPHGIGYANESGVPLARPFVKYTPDLAALLHAHKPGGPQPAWPR